MQIWQMCVFGVMAATVSFRPVAMIRKSAPLSRFAKKASQSENTAVEKVPLPAFTVGLDTSRFPGAALPPVQLGACILQRTREIGYLGNPEPSFGSARYPVASAIEPTAEMVSL